MNIELIKKKLEEDQQKMSSKSNVFWKPPLGQTLIRMVRYKFDHDNPFVELFFHFDIVKGKPILSPVSYGDPDPIDEFAQKLKQRGTKEDYKIGCKLEPKRRVFLPIVVRGEETQGVKVWGIGTQVYDELRGVCTDPDYGDISDTFKGRDILVEHLSPKEANNVWGKTNIRVKPNITPLHTNAEVIQSILENQPNIDELYTRYTYAELQDILDKYLSTDNEKTNSDTTESQPARSAASITPATPQKSIGYMKNDKVQSAVSAFDELLGK